MWSGIIANIVVLQSNLTLAHPGLAKLVLSSEQSLCSKSVLNLRFNLALAGLGLVMLQGLVPARKGVFPISEGVPRYFPQQDWFCGSRSCRMVATHMLKSRKVKSQGEKSWHLAGESPQNLSLLPLPVNTAGLESLGCLGLGSSCSVFCSYSGRNGLLRPEMTARQPLL